MSDDIPSLWTPEDCARYLGVARWTFVNRISKLPTFPKPRVELTRRTRRWHPDDVRDWQYRAGRKPASPVSPPCLPQTPGSRLAAS